MRVLDILRPPLVAIDVGTAFTRVCFGPAGTVELPSLVQENVGGAVVARPTMRSGVVADTAGVATVVAKLLDSRRGAWRRRPGAVVCAPTDVSPEEREALIEAVAEGGASVVAVVPEPLAAAIGAGLDITSEYATAVVDIGDGVTDLAVFRNAAMIHAEALRIGCGTLRAAVHDWLELQRHEAVPLSGETVENVVRAYCRTGAPAAGGMLPSATRIAVRRDDLEMLLEPVLEAIASFVAAGIRNLPDPLAAEIIESGIHLTGGGAKLDRLVERIEERAGLAPACAPEPLTAVVRGAGEMLRNRRLLAMTQS